MIAFFSIILSNNHNSESQYKRKLKDWDFGKNLTALGCQAIAADLEKRHLSSTSATAVVKGIPLSSTRLERALKRHNRPTLACKWQKSMSYHGP